MAEETVTLSSFVEQEEASDETWGPPTYQVEAGSCAGCGAKSDRRWRDGEQLVCPDCKTW